MNQKFFLISIAVLVILLITSCSTISDYYEPEMYSVAYYSIDNSELIPDNFEDEEYLSTTESDLLIHKKLWQKIRDVIPDEYEQYITYFRIDSDGIENTMAYVESDTVDNDYSESVDLSSWTMSVDIVDIIDRFGNFREEGIETIIHEFAHILSLNSMQADALDVVHWEDSDWLEDWDFNKSYKMYDSIAKDDSYLNQFFQKFWGSEMYQEWIEIELYIDSDEEYYEALDTLSIKYYNNFVSDYALTNPEEDFAETFTYFVLMDKPENRTISNEKILFFYDIEKMVIIRDQIRNNLGL